MEKDKLEPLGVPGLRYSRAEAVARPGHTARVLPVDRALVRALLAVAGNPPVKLQLWNGEELGSATQPHGRLRINDRSALFRLIADPELHFGDLYSNGRLEVEGDLVRFIETTYRARHAATGKLRHLAGWLRTRPRKNSLSGSRSNIHHHYDISNAFYQLWLDREAMQYTCAYFPDPAMTLEQAQVAKLHHVCRKLRLQPGQTVAEAGCGWGGLARFMARHYGVRVRAYNISREQIAFARERAAQEGLADRVEYVEDDYRNISGEYDAFVSVGMLEHVGKSNYRALGAVIDRCLKPHGRGLIHTIGRNRPALMNAWIERRIFPGAYPPTLGEMSAIFEPYAFSIQDVENLRLHYAKTLEHWLERFEHHGEQILEMFDERFLRAWRVYLAGSIAAFTTGALQLFQVVFTRPGVQDLPWSRAHLYHDHPGEGGA